MKWLLNLINWFRSPTMSVLDKVLSLPTDGSTPSFLKSLQTLFPAIINRISAEHLTGAEREANEFSASQAELAYQRQREFYNDFQSPQSMVNQYRDAGLNPALMYGSGASASSAIGSSAPSSVNPQGGSIDPVQLIGTIAGLRLRAKEVKAETDLKASNSYYLREQGDLIRKQNNIFYQQWQLEQEIRGANLNSIKENTLWTISRNQLTQAQISETEAKTAKTHWEALTAKVSYDFAEEMNQSLIDLRRAQIAYQNAETRLANVSSDIKEQELKELKETYEARKATINSQMRKAAAEAGISENELEYWMTGKSLEAMSIQADCFNAYKTTNPLVGGQEISPYSPNYRGIVDGSFFTNPYEDTASYDISSGTRSQQAPEEKPVNRWWNQTYSDRIIEARRKREERRERSKDRVNYKPYGRTNFYSR